MGYNAKAIANFFLDIAKERGDKVTPLKIQKLVYFSHGWHLALTDGKPLVNDEYIEAWTYGPVFPSLYHEFKQYGGDPIDGYAIDVYWNEEKKDSDYRIPNVEESDVPTKKFLEKIWDVYGSKTPLQLSMISHAPDSPWAQTNRGGEGFMNVNICNALIKDYYKKIMEKNCGN